MEVTNNSPFGIKVWGGIHQDETLTATGAVTWAPGTLLGRITASDKMTAYTSGATDGSEVPIAVLPYEVVFAGAGDKAERPLIDGQVRKGDLVAHGVGAITTAEADQLRSYGIVALDVTQLADQDNQ